MYLGDAHNFGRRVSLAPNGLIHKPRSLAWEWLLLSAESPLRQLVESEARAHGIASPFAGIPCLKFDLGSTSVSEDGGYVERLEWESGSLAADADAVAIAGRSAALCAWLGLSDLHAENMAVGRLSDGTAIVAPLDVEGGLYDYELLNQTLLIPGGGIGEQVAGLSTLIHGMREARNVGVAAAFCAGYVEVFEFLSEIEHAIYTAIFSAFDPDTLHTRLIFRATKDYAAFLRGAAAERDFEPPLCDEERRQLERGDVPYFCRTLAKRDVLAYRTPSELRPVTLPVGLTEGVLAYSPVIVGTRWRRCNFNVLKRAGVMQLARVVDPGCDGETMAHGVRLTFESDWIIFEAPAGWRVRVQRSRPGGSRGQKHLSELSTRI